MDSKTLRNYWDFSNASEVPKETISRYLSETAKNKREPNFSFIKKFVEFGGDANWLLNDKDQRSLSDKDIEVKYDAYGKSDLINKLNELFIALRNHNEKINSLDKNEILNLLELTEEAFNLLLQIINNNEPAFTGNYRSNRIDVINRLEERTKKLLNNFDAVIDNKQQYKTNLD